MARFKFLAVTKLFFFFFPVALHLWPLVLTTAGGRLTEATSSGAAVGAFCGKFSKLVYFARCRMAGERMGPEGEGNLSNYIAMCLLAHMDLAWGIVRHQAASTGQTGSYLHPAAGPTPGDSRLEGGGPRRARPNAAAQRV